MENRSTIHEDNFNRPNCYIPFDTFDRCAVSSGGCVACQSYSGDLWTRSTLSGDWWGFRNELAAKGMTIDMSLTQSAQGIVHGGKDTGWQYSGGRGDINLSLDTQKLGLWP